MTTESTQQSLVALVDAYARRVTPAILEQHADGENSVSSPLGIWLVLAACAGAAAGDDLAALEEVLGCSAPDALELLRRFLDDPPPALRSALALWVRTSDHSSPLVEWSASLPNAVERGPIPTQKEADAWAERHTAGLIPKFPLEMTALTRIVLTSAVATKVSWQEPFEVKPALSHLGSASPWRNRVDHVLFDRQVHSPTMLVNTEAAGVVAAHFALASEDVAVMSVAADPSLDRQVVLEAAYEVATIVEADRVARAKCSLWDLPLGRGHSWDITEHEVPAPVTERQERIDGAILVAWSAESSLDLTTSDRFGANAALSALFTLLGPSPGGDNARALHSAMARYTRTGFEAAALTTLMLSSGRSLARPPTDTGIERRATLLFDHPYALVALAGTEADFRQVRLRHPETYCLPLFTVWVAEPEEPEAEPG